MNAAKSQPLLQLFTDWSNTGLDATNVCVTVCSLASSTFASRYSSLSAKRFMGLMFAIWVIHFRERIPLQETNDNQNTGAEKHETHALASDTRITRHAT